jgi:hypothetical protein
MSKLRRVPNDDWIAWSLLARPRQKRQGIDERGIALKPKTDRSGFWMFQNDPHQENNLLASAKRLWGVSGVVVSKSVADSCVFAFQLPHSAAVCYQKSGKLRRAT